MPSDIRRSANSDTMMASSTSMPTARMSENSTTMLTVSPASCSPSTPARNEAGMAMPMNSEARKPSANRITTDHQQDAGQDRVLQIGQHLADHLRLVLREGDVRRLAGQVLLQAARRSPSRHRRSRSGWRRCAWTPRSSSAGLPLTRVTEVASLKVGLISARSPSVTAAPASRHHRHLEGVLRMLDQARHLDGEAAGLGPRARRPRSGCWRSEKPVMNWSSETP